jgi:DegV family protein with EDD domain
MEKLPGTKIYIVDTLSATHGHHLLLKQGIRMRDEGLTAEQTAEELNVTAPKIQHWFMVDDLHHLRRGGRISGASAVLGTLLKIKPILVVNGKGKLDVVKKVHGVKKAIDYFMDAISRYKPAGNGEFLLVNANAHGYAAELAERIRAAYPDCPVSIGWVGPVIGAHTGSGMFGVTFIGADRE